MLRNNNENNGAPEATYNFVHGESLPSRINSSPPNPRIIAQIQQEQSGDLASENDILPARTFDEEHKLITELTANQTKIKHLKEMVEMVKTSNKQLGIAIASIMAGFYTEQSNVAIASLFESSHSLEGLSARSKVTESFNNRNVEVPRNLQEKLAATQTEIEALEKIFSNFSARMKALTLDLNRAKSELINERQRQERQLARVAMAQSIDFLPSLSSLPANFFVNNAFSPEYYARGATSGLRVSHTHDPVLPQVGNNPHSNSVLFFAPRAQSPQPLTMNEFFPSLTSSPSRHF